MKLAIAAFAASVLIALSGAVYAQDTTTPSPTMEAQQPSGAPSTGFGGAN